MSATRLSPIGPLTRPRVTLERVALPAKPWLPLPRPRPSTRLNQFSWETFNKIFLKLLWPKTSQLAKFSSSLSLTTEGADSQSQWPTTSRLCRWLVKKACGSGLTPAVSLKTRFSLRRSKRDMKISRSVKLLAKCLISPILRPWVLKRCTRMRVVAFSSTEIRLLWPPPSWKPSTSQLRDRRPQITGTGTDRTRVWLAKQSSKLWLALWWLSMRKFAGKE